MGCVSSLAGEAEDWHLSSEVCSNGMVPGLGAGAFWVTDSFHLAHEALTNAIIFDLPCALSDTLGVLGLRLSG